MNYKNTREFFLNNLTDEELFFKINNLYVVNDWDLGLLVIGPDRSDLSKYRVKRIIESTVRTLDIYLECNDRTHEKIFDSLEDALIEARKYILEVIFPSNEKLRFLKIRNPDAPATDKQIAHIKDLYNGICDPNLTKSGASLLINTYEIKHVFRRRIFDLKPIFYIEGEIIYEGKLKESKKNNDESVHEKPWMPGDDDEEEIQKLMKGDDIYTEI